MRPFCVDQHMKRSLHLLVLTVLAALLSSLLSPWAGPAAAEDAPTVTITSNKTTYVAGQTAAVRFTVAGAGSSTNLRVVLVASTGKSVVLHDAEVYDDVLDKSVAMYINSRIYAYVGGATEPSASKGFPVKALVGTRPRGGYLGYSGDYAIFPKGSSPVFRSTTFPKRPKVRCLTHEVQRLYAAGWGTVLRGSCRVQDKNGNVDWQWAGKHGSGVKFRVRATFAGDSWNQPSSAPYSYFKFK